MKLENCDVALGLAATLAIAAFGFGSVTASAATGVDEDCPETRAEIVAEISPPSLHVNAVEHVGDTSVTATDSAAARPLASGTDTQTSALLNKALPRPAGDSDSIASEKDSTRDLPPTDMRLPGVADEDLPRFRRQMFRTDI